MIGVVKAYSTRVGGGPFPTEQDNEIGQHIRDRGNEYGTVTRRPRRCGWFDAVAVRYTARLSGVDCAGRHAARRAQRAAGEMKICTAYEIDGRRMTQFPSHVDDLRRAMPVYETLPGWQEEITDSPADGRFAGERPAIFDAAEPRLIGRPVEVVSVGPDREQTIFTRSAAELVGAT